MYWSKSSSYSIRCMLLVMIAALQSAVFAQTPPPLPQLATGANESVFASVQETYYVSPTGDNNNPGTSSAPFKTFAKGVSKGVERKNAGVNVKIIIKNGTYRERTNIPQVTTDTDACLIIEAENIGQAIISGSEDWSGQWVQEGSNWTHSWTYDWGVGPSQAQVTNELGRRRELFFVENTLYTQVLSQANLIQGTYYVDETADKVYIRPLAGVNMNTALIEAGIKQELFTISANRKNIAIKGLVFQHEVSFATNPAEDDKPAFRVGKDCSNFLIQDVSFEWNNGTGFRTFAKSKFRQDFTFRRVKFNNNGGGGMNYSNSQNGLFEDCETSYNCFRFNWAGQIQGFDAGAFKLASSHRTTFIRHKTIGNYGRGMWWDIANRDMTAKDCYVADNYLSGIFVEYSFGPALIENCTIINTKKSNQVTLRNQGGLQFASTANLTIRNCTIKNNIQSQIKCWDQQREMTDHLTGEVKRYDSTNVGNVYLRNNVVEATDTASVIDIPSWPYLKNTWNSNNNTYVHSGKNKAFRVYAGGREDGDGGSDANYFIASYYTFDEWKQYINGDVNSTYNAFLTFSQVDSYFGNAVNYEPLNLTRWSVLYKGDNQGYAINTGNYSNLSGQRLGEYALVKNRSYGNFTMTIKAASAENFSTNTSPDYAIVFGYQDADNYFYVNFTNTATELFRVVAGVRQAAIATSTLAAFSDTAYKAIEVSRAGNKVLVKQGNTLLLNSTNPALSATGSIGIGSFDDAAYFDDVVIEEQISRIALSLSDSGRTYSACDTVKLKADLINFEPGAYVRFYDNGQLLGSDNNGSDGYGFSGKLAAGSKTLTAIATDSVGNTATSEEIAITVTADTTPPVITVKDSPAVLWPPNHKYHSFNISDFVLAVTDSCTGVLPLTGVRITKVSSDEAEDAPGSGNTRNDISIGRDCQSVQLRAERQGNGNGRVYTIEVAISDPFGNEGTASYQVQVPRDRQPGAVAIADAPAYNINCGAAQGFSQKKVGEDFPENEDGSLSAYPNPFSGQATIRYQLTDAALVRLEVYNAMSQKVATLVNRRQEAGLYEAVVEGANLPEGFYICRLQAGNKVQTVKIVLVKN